MAQFDRWIANRMAMLFGSQLAQKTLKCLSIAGLVLVWFMVFYHSSILNGVLVTIASILTWGFPPAGVAVMIVAISFDSSFQIWGGIVVDIPEFLFAACFFAFLLRARLNSLDWRPIIWGTPFLLAVFLSGVLNIEWYKVLPHVIRNSEIVLAMFLALNAFNPDYAIKGAGLLDVSLWRVFGSYESRSVPWANLGILSASLVHFSIGILQFVEGGASDTRITSTFGNPNQLAGYLILVAPFCIIFAFSSLTRWLRVCSFYIALATVLALFLTYSRGGWLGAFFGMGTVLLLGLYYLKRDPERTLYDSLSALIRRNAFFIGGNLVLLVGGLILLLTTPSMKHYLSEIEGTLQQRQRYGYFSDIGRARLPYWRLGLDVWSEHPIWGVGPGAYEEHVQRYVEENPEIADKTQNLKAFQKLATAHTHSLYLHLLTSLGISGFLGFAFMLSMIGQSFWRGRGLSLPTGGLGLICGFLVHGLFDVTFPSLALEIGLLLGVAVPLKTEQAVKLTGL